MATLSAVTTPSINVPPNRDPSPLKDGSNVRDKFASTQKANESLAKTDAGTQRDYQKQQNFANSGQNESAPLQTGTRRGNLLDLTV